jgi:Tfp pilus assembly ATPase PilU
MQTFMQHLIQLVLEGRVDEEIAANAATNRHDFLVALEAAKKHKAADEREAAEAAAETGQNGSVQSLGATLR